MERTETTTDSKATQGALLAASLTGVLAFVTFWAFTENTSVQNSAPGVPVDSQSADNPVTAGDNVKAYPVSCLTGRELVVDELDGQPILVSW